MHGAPMHAVHPSQMRGPGQSRALGSMGSGSHQGLHGMQMDTGMGQLSRHGSFGPAMQQGGALSLPYALVATACWWPLPPCLPHAQFYSIGRQRVHNPCC
jgi:hypothetical protein